MLPSRGNRTAAIGLVVDAHLSQDLVAARADEQTDLAATVTGATRDGHAAFSGTHRTDLAGL
jgi:hypothetical protein